MDEKSLIKKYQREITTLKEELQQLKCGMMGNPYTSASAQEDLVNLKLQVCPLHNTRTRRDTPFILMFCHFLC